MKKIYLYIKTSPFGLKYLGKTVQNPFVYTGSGKRWLNHIKFHNFTVDDIETEIIFESYDEKEIQQKGLYYSEFYNIVKSDEWANLKQEKGDGGAYYETFEQKVKRSKSLIGNHNFFGGNVTFTPWCKGKKMTSEYCLKIGKGIKLSRTIKHECEHCHKKVDSANLVKHHNSNCKLNPNYVQKNLSCEYCGKIMDAANLGKYHNKNCKYKI